MQVSECEELTRHLVDNRGWGFWFRIVQWVFAVICLALIAFSFSRFKGYADYTGWVWGPIGVAFVTLPFKISLTLGYMGCGIPSRSPRSRPENSVTLV